MSPHTANACVIDADAFLNHWQGHRRVTRRFIEAFPEQELFNLSIGGMRPFSALVLEFIGMAVPSLKGVISGQWEYGAPVSPASRAELLQVWDETTTAIDTLWPTIPPHRFQEVDKAFGQWEMTGASLLTYLVDNEIHHRAQASVYLRSIGIQPPFFYDRM